MDSLWSDHEEIVRVIKEHAREMNEPASSHVLHKWDDMCKPLMEKVGVFVHGVLLDLILRDYKELVERYMRKMRKSYARMYFLDLDDDEM